MYACFSQDLKTLKTIFKRQLQEFKRNVNKRQSIILINNVEYYCKKLTIKLYDESIVPKCT